MVLRHAAALGWANRECFMESSINQAKTRFTEAVATKAQGERAVVTEHDWAVAELRPVQPTSGTNFEKAAVVRRELELDGLRVNLPPEFEDPAFSRQVLALED